ncbi:MAG: hypothetical protein AAGF20_00640 [Pseudomonadota bacterium]
MGLPAYAPEKTEPKATETVGDLAGSQASSAPVMADLDLDAVPSPARQLQDRLDAHFAPMAKRLSARFVTLLVGLTCLGTWLSGYGLYASL